MSSKIKVDTIENVAGSGNVSLGSGHNLVVPGNITGSGTATITGDLTVDTSTLKVDSSNNKVGIGLTAPQELLHIKDGSIAVGNGTASNNARVGKIGFSTDSSNSRFIGMESFRLGDAANADLRFHTFGGDSDSGERMRIHTNGVVSVTDGIALGVGTANTASNILNDYEEGTWTPNCATAGVSGSYSVQLGRYIKIGRLVQCIFNLTTSGAYTGSTNQVFKIGGLPFANKAYDGSLYAGGNIGYYFNINTVDTCKQIVYQIPSGSATSFELKGTGDGQGEISIIVSNMDNYSTIRGQLVYHTV